MRVFFSIRYDTIRYEGLKEDLLFEEFSANFRRIFRIFGEFSEFSANFQNFRRIFGEFSEFSANFWNFRRKKTKKSLVLRISRYSIWEVRYDILFDIRKSPIYRHSINSRYDILPPDQDACASEDLTIRARRVHFLMLTFNMVPQTPRKLKWDYRMKKKSLST